MSRRPFLFALVALVLALAVSGARAAPTTGIRLERLVPARTLAFASLEDVGRWEERFQTTALGKLFAEPEMKAFVAPIAEDLKKMAEEPSQPGAAPHRGAFGLPPEVTELAKHLQGLSGQVSVALVDVDLESHQVTAAGCLDFGDHLSDFLTFLTRLAKDQSPDKPPISFEERNGHPYWSVLQGEGKPPIVTATPVGTAILVSTDAAWLDATLKSSAADVPDSLAASEAFQASRAGAGGDSLALLVHANVPAVLAKAKVEGEGRRVVDALGLDAVRSAAYGIAIQGDGFLETFVLDAPKADHGLFPLLAMKPTSHRMLSLAPASAFAYSESTISLSALLPRVHDLVARIDEHQAKKIEDWLKEASERVGLDIQKEVMEGLSDEVAYWIGLPETGGLYPELAVALGVKDPKSFEGVFERTVAGVAGLVSKEERVTATTRTLDYRGQRLHVVDLGGVGHRMVPFTPTWTILGDRLVITAVPHAMKEIVLRSQQGSEGAGGLAAQEDVRSLLRVAPEGHGGFGYLDLQSILALAYDTAVPALETFAKPNMLPVPVRLDWAQLPATRTIRPYLRSLGEFVSVDDKGLRLSIHGPIPIVLPLAVGGAMAAAFTARRMTEHRISVGVPTEEPPPPMSDESQVLEVSAAVQKYVAEHGRLPASLAAMGVLLPKDPWGRAFELRPHDDGTYEIRSAGADGVWGTDDDVVHEGRVGAGGSKR